MNPIYYNCKAKNKIVADLSSSGAVSAILADAIIRKGGLVYGAMYTRDFKQVKVDWVDNIYDYYKHIAKSKYVYSFMPKFNAIKSQLDSGRLVLVGALPCQVVALRKYLGRDYDNLYTASLKCHGGMKPSLYREFVERIERENGSRVFSADFRRNHESAFHVRFENGIVKSYATDMFLSNDMAQCSKCKVKWSNDCSDFIVGDCWEYINNKDKMFDPSLTVWDGISYFKICTEKGLSMFDEIKDQLHYKEFDASKMQG